MARKWRTRLFCMLVILSCSYPIAAFGGYLPRGFVYVDEVVPGIQVELRYYTNHNFVGEKVDGYLAPRCILTQQAADALKGVQEDLKPFGLGLKIYDGYRPQRAVDHFIRWGKDLGDVRTKAEFYPETPKETLFDGYIAKKSGHSRGSTVDLTIVVLDPNGKGADLDMGTGFDYLGVQSWPDNPDMTAFQRAHRMLLRQVMEKHGFKPYDKEWWHFTLKDEPYPDTFFNFPIR